MMRIIKNFRYIIGLVILLLFANQAWAEEWIYHATSDTRVTYYDKSSIKKVNENIISLYTKQVLKEDGKIKYFSFLQNINKAPDNPEVISHILGLSEIDCEKNKIKESSLVIYDENNNVLYSAPADETDDWRDIPSISIGKKLSNIVCEKPVAPEDAVRKLVSKWLDSWKSGNMENYRNCYTSDFQSKGMNLDDWVSHKANIYRKSGNINISIDQLRISVKENRATAEFNQYYSSSKFTDTGKKKLELKKINNEWKIYREMM